MKKLLVLSGLVVTLILCGCTTNKASQKSSPMVSFMDFVNKTKCTFVAQDDIYFEETEETVPGFILNLTDFSAGSMTSCIHSYQTQMRLESFGLIYKSKRSTGKVVKINDNFLKPEGTTVVVTLKVNDKYVSSSDDIFNLSKVNKIDFEVTSVTGREVAAPAYTGGNVWYRRSK